jgi:hypothetical protein
LHAGLRVQRASGVSCALFSWGKISLHNSGASRREIAEVHLNSTSLRGA